MARGYRWNQIQAPKGNARDVLAAGELFGQATNTISGVLQQQADREVASANNAFNDALLGAKTAEDVDKLRTTYKDLPNSNLLNREKISAGLDSKANNLRTQELNQLMFQEQKAQKEQQTADKKSLDLLRSSLVSDPTTLQGEFGGLSVDKINTLAIKHGISRNAVNQFMQEQTAQDAFKSAQTSKTEVSRSNEAVQRATSYDDKGNPTVDTEKLTGLFKEYNLPNPEQRTQQYMQKVRAAERAPQLLKEQAFQEDLRGQVETVSRIGDNQERGKAQNLITLMQDVWTLPKYNKLKEKINDKGGLTWVKKAISDATTVDATFGNEWNEGGEIGVLTGMIEDYNP